MHTRTAYLNSLTVATELLTFHIDDIIITLSWTQQELESSEVDYSVSIVPQAPISQETRNNITLRVSYNAVYIMSIVASVCQQNVFNSNVTLNYGT